MAKSNREDRIRQEEGRVAGLSQELYELTEPFRRSLSAHLSPDPALVARIRAKEELLTAALDELEQLIGETD